ncbi:MAG: hypothetical protein U0Z44_02965 [Kouleothrix sp.]
MIEQSASWLAPSQPPNLEHARRPAGAMRSGYCGILPRGMLLVIALISGELISQTVPQRCWG